MDLQNIIKSNEGVGRSFNCYERNITAINSRLF